MMSRVQIVPKLTCATLYLLLNSCSSRVESPTHTFMVYEEDSITIAESTGGPKYQEPIFTFEEVVRIEENEENIDSLLDNAFEYMLGEDGNYYLNDWGNDRIVVFGTDGKYIRSIGQEGDGPGEFRNPTLLWIRNDKLAVFDEMHKRTSLFNMDGTLYQAYSLIKRSGSIRVIYPTTTGDMVLIRRIYGPRDSKEIYVQKIALVFAAGGDTLAQVTSPMIITGYRIDVPNSSMSTRVNPFFGHAADVIYQPDKGIISYYTGEPVIRVFGLDGNQISEIRIDTKPEPVTSKDRQGIMRYLNEEMKNAPVGILQIVTRTRKENAIIPNTKSFWASVLVDDAGYFWLQKHVDYSLEQEERDRPSFRILSPTGEYLGDTTIPEGRFTISRGHLLTRQENEMTGERDFIVYQIISAVEGFVYP